MALSLAKLQLEFTKLLDSSHPQFVGFGTNPVAAATNWANVLFKYWLDAQTVLSQCKIDSVTFAAKKAAFITTLAPVLLPVGLPPAVAGALEAATITAWTGQLFIPIAPITGAVVTVPPVPGLIATQLGGLFLDVKSSASAKAEQFAKVFQASAKKIKVTTTVPPVATVELLMVVP